MFYNAFCSCTNGDNRAPNVILGGERYILNAKLLEFLQFVNYCSYPKQFIRKETNFLKKLGEH